MPSKHRLAALGAIASVVLTAGSRSIAPLHAQLPAESYVGLLNVIWAEGQAGQGTSRGPQFSLVQNDGQVLSLDLSGHEGEAFVNFGKQVVIVGRTVRPPVPTGFNEPRSVGAVRVESITQNRPQAVKPLTVSGTRKVIYLLLKFSDDSSTTHPPVFYTDLNNPDVPPAGEPFPATINGFFKKTSGNVFSWTGVVGGVGGLGAPGGWLTLPHPKNYYAPCGWNFACATVATLGDDATALGRAEGIDFKLYDNINFVLNNDLDCCAYGGGYFSSVDVKFYGATWEPPWGQETSSYAHELGHSIGLPHSGWVYYSYDSPWDLMSTRVVINSTNCGSYFSFNSGSTQNLACPEPADGYIGAHRDYLGWIPAANEVVVAAGSGAAVDLEGSSLPFGAAKKLIKICVSGFACTGGAAHFFTVEARVKNLGSTSQFDNGIPGEGIIIHDVQMDRPAISGPCFFNNQSGWALPVDATPGDYDSAACNTGGRFYPNYGLFNAQWLVGQTYMNSEFAFSVAVQSRTNSVFHVVVTALPTPSVVTQAATNVTMNGATLNGTVNPNGANTTASFEYGVTVGYGSQIAASPAPGSGSSPVAVSATVTGLSCGSTYHFRLTATNGVGSAAGGDVTLTTTSCTSTLSVTPSSVHFGATKNGGAGALANVTPAQSLTVSFSGVVPSWTASSDQPWLQITNGSGSGAKTFTAGIVNPGNVIGGATNLSGAITVSAPTASPFVIQVTLAVQQVVGSSASPFGQVEAPALNASGIQGAIGVSGWVLDDIAVSTVKIYRNCLSPSEPSSNCSTGLVPGSPSIALVYVGDAVFVSGARPDLETAFPTTPLNYRGGWGYLMLTNMLPHTSGVYAQYGGDGPLTLYAIATDIEGHSTLLGRNWSNDHSPTPITMANDTIAKPFGAIDTPAQGATASGTFANFGWVLTPDSNTIADGSDILVPLAGSTLFVFVDGVSVGNVAYNQCRGNVGNPPPAGVYCNDDVASIFGNPTTQPPLTPRSSNPTRYRNLDSGRGPQGSFAVNTAAMSNGLHSIAWSATDSNGRVEGIGSRNFFVLNSGSGSSAIATGVRALDRYQPSKRAISMRTGFDLRAPMTKIARDDADRRRVTVPLLGRIEIDFAGPVDGAYLMANDELRELPVGSSLDRKAGRFFWTPAAGYLGMYRLAFIVGNERVVVDVLVAAR